MHILSIVLLSVLLFTSGAAEKPFQFASNGKAQCVIALPANVGKFDKLAAEELQIYLGKMTGAKFQVIAENKVKGKAIYLGQSAAAAKAGLKGFKGEEWCICSPDGQKLILTGSRKIGSYYAVWALLHKMGCYALTWDADAVPQNKNAVYNGKFERKQPAFAARMIFDEYPYHFRNVRADQKVIDAYVRWLLRSHINGEQVKFIPSLYTYSSNNLAQSYPYHTFDLFVPPEKYFKTHPEYYTMDQHGKRLRPRAHYDSNLCMSNPEVAKVVLQTLREMIRKDRTTRPKEDWAFVYDISRCDRIDYICKCPNCMAISKEEGTEIGLLMRFINTIAREIRKEYPDIIIRTSGEMGRNPLPTKTLPESNVLVRIGDQFTVSDPFVPLSHPINKGSKQSLDKWKGLAKQYALWDYWNLGGGVYFNPPRVETVFDALQSDFRYFRDYGIMELFIEAERDYASPQNFIDATYFVANQLMVDPDEDPEKLVDIFFKYYYGPAAPALKKWFNEIRAGIKKHPTRQASMGAANWCYANVPFTFNSYKMLKKQAEALPKNSVYRNRVEWERITVIWSMLAHKPSYQKILKENKMDMKMLIAECRDLVRRYIRRFPSRRPQFFDKTFETRFIPCANELVIPEKFKNVPEEDFRMVTWPYMTGYAPLGSGLADDPESIQGKALKSSHKDPSYHGVNKRLPGKYGFRSTHFCLGNSRDVGGGNINLFLKEVPQDEKYHWFRIPGKIELKHKSSFWGHGWAIQAKTSHLYMLTDGNAADNTWDEVWVSAKFTGPAYVKGSKKENAIWVDMLVLTRKPAKK